MSRVLVLGAYMHQMENTAAHVAHELADLKPHGLRAIKDDGVIQLWAGIGGRSTNPYLAKRTIVTADPPAPKYPLMNRLLELADLDAYDYVVCVEDDITLPPGFLPDFLAAQRNLGFALAQPARTPDSTTHYDLVLQQPGAYARETRFVEIGPLFSIAREAFPLLLPFDETSPWGFGYEFVWAKTIQDAGLTMGIIDATPVEHTLRPPGRSFSYAEAEKTWPRLLEQREHLSREECLRTLHTHQLPLVGANEGSK